MTTDTLSERIDAEFAAARQRVEHLKTEKVEEFQSRQQRLEKFEQVLDELRDVWTSRLNGLAQKFGDRVKLQPNVAPARRSATLAFKSELASVDLRFAVSPDEEVRNLVFSYDLDILPILMKFNSHAEIQFPLDNVDAKALGQWIDDCCIDFVKTYLSLHENEYYLKGHMVEDPIAKIRFPKYAASATCQHEGKTYHFIDGSTLEAFQKQHA